MSLADLPLFAPPRCTRQLQRFDGPDITEADVPRLTTQLQVVREFLSSGEWRTLTQIAEAAHCTTQSASARVRDLRKSRHGGFSVERRRIPDTAVFQYRIAPTVRR